jgi:hypothetical protein
MENKNQDWRRKGKAKTGMAGKCKERFATVYIETVEKQTKYKNAPCVVKKPKILRGP